MNVGNVVKSFFLGLGIGALVLLIDLLGGKPVDNATPWALSILASGAIGLLIGLVTEWLTSLLPIRLARTGTYFLINGLIALIVTAIIMVALVLITGGTATRAGWPSIVGTILAIVAVANLIDYLLHRRTQARLRAVQARIPADE